MEKRTLGLGSDGYSLWGSSAGARMAATIGSRGVAHYGGDGVPSRITPAARRRASAGPDIDT
jgi:hypothetical protein